MANTLRISEGASLALHSMVLLASRPHQPLSTREVAATLAISEAHLAKVFQRLAKAGLVTSTRGPRGGFALGRAPQAISLLEVYETIDGPVGASDCLLGEPVCRGHGCILGNLVKSVNDQMRNYLTATRLSDVTAFHTANVESPGAPAQ